MLWAVITRLNDVLAVIGFGTVMYGVIRVTRKFSR